MFSMKSWRNYVPQIPVIETIVEKRDLKFWRFEFEPGLVYRYRLDQEDNDKLEHSLDIAYYVEGQITIV